VKGLYKKARAGQVKEFTGISAPYEAPVAPELEVQSGEWTTERCLAVLMDYVEQHLAYRPARLQAVK
jgi:adenylylsulfate kinase